MAKDKSISELLSDLGIRHERDERSTFTGEHRLYRGDEFLGSFDAHAAVELIHSMSEAA